MGNAKAPHVARSYDGKEFTEPKDVTFTASRSERNENPSSLSVKDAAKVFNNAKDSPSAT